MSLALLNVLGDTSLRSAVVAALVAVVLVMWRVRDVRVRHAAWASALFAMLLMPALTAIVPALTIPFRS